MSEPPKKRPSFWSLFNEIEEEPACGPVFSDLLRGTGGDSSTDPAETNCAVEPNPGTFFWAMRDLPIAEAGKHLLVCGATGSGKTIAIQLFLQSIVDRFRANPVSRKAPEQLILFDAKTDLIPFLAGQGLSPENDLWILNPYDTRSAVWHPAEAVQTPAMARSLAALLVPEEKKSTAPYFADAARELVTAVILGLNRAAGQDWTLRDLLCALDSRDHIKQVSSQDPRGQVLAKRILDDEKHSNGVLSTLGTKLGPFEQVAALWVSNRSGRRFSIKAFLDEPGVLVLGNDPVLRSSFWPMNALLLKALSQEILRRPNARPPHHPRHWFVLDEFRAMERVDCMHDLLNRGRSKGVSVLLGIQSVEGLTEIYGKPGCEDLLSQCANKMFLRAGGPETAEWAERFFGRVRAVERSTGYSRSREGSTESEQFSIQERSLFLPSVFLDLPLPGPGGPYCAVCDVPSLRETLIVERRFDEVVSWCSSPADESVVPSVSPRNDLDGQSLGPWTPSEERRFCHPPPENRKPPSADPGDPPNPPLPGRHSV